MQENKNIKATVAAIISHRGRIFLEKRSSGIREGGKWGLPRGHIDFGEKATDAIKREVMEETGYSAEKVKFLGYQDEFIPELEVHSVVLVFSCQLGSKKNRKDGESVKQGWFNEKEIAKLKTAFTHRKIIDRFWKSGEEEDKAT